MLASLRLADAIRYFELVEKSVPLQHRRVVKTSAVLWGKWLFYGLLAIGAIRCLAYVTWESEVIPVLALAEIVAVVAVVRLLVNGLRGLIALATKRQVLRPYGMRALVSIGMLGAAFFYFHEVLAFQAQDYKKAQIFQLAATPLLEKYHQAHGQYPESLDGMSSLTSLPHRCTYFRPHNLADGQLFDGYIFFFKGIPFFSGTYVYSSKKNHWSWIDD